MPKRNPLRWPWWLGLLLAAISYVLLAEIAPRLEIGHPYLQLVVQATAPKLAILVALAFLLVAGSSAMAAYQRRRLLDRQQSLESLRQTSWQDFEGLVGEIYRRQGWRVRETGGGGADGGIDLILTGKGENWLVQCKRWRRDPVGVKVVRELLGVVAGEHANGGILITTSTFTADAVRFAQGKPLELVDGEALLHQVKTVQKSGGPISSTVPPPVPVLPETTRATPTLSISSLHRPPNAPLCPQCRWPMVQRVARQGANAGQAFWGCTQFPACRGTRRVTDGSDRE